MYIKKKTSIGKCAYYIRFSSQTIYHLGNLYKVGGDSFLVFRCKSTFQNCCETLILSDLGERIQGP